MYQQQKTVIMLLLRFAIYSHISFYITWSDIIFLIFPCSSCTW